jgi:hypothetical protein
MMPLAYLLLIKDFNEIPYDYDVENENYDFAKSENNNTPEVVDNNIERSYLDDAYRKAVYTFILK